VLRRRVGHYVITWRRQHGEEEVIMMMVVVLSWFMSWG